MKVSEGKARRGTKKTTVVQWIDGSVTIHQDTNYIVLGKEIVRGLYDDLSEFYQSLQGSVNDGN